MRCDAAEPPRLQTRLPALEGALHYHAFAAAFVTSRSDVSNKQAYGSIATPATRRNASRMPPLSARRRPSTPLSDDAAAFFAATGVIRAFLPDRHVRRTVTQRPLRRILRAAARYFDRNGNAKHFQQSCVRTLFFA